jgi:hypothetical protein
MSCSAILLGESGQLYYLHTGEYSYHIGDLNDWTGKSVNSIAHICDMPEDYKVIFTSVSYHENSYRSSSDSYYKYSWDSTQEALLKELLPKIGRSEDPYTRSGAEKVAAGDGKDYSLMDNINTWAYKSSTTYNYD